mgnify:CR=1 FL=1
MVSNHKIKEFLFVVVLGVSGYLAYVIAKFFTPDTSSFGGIITEQVSIFSPKFITIFAISIILIAGTLFGVMFSIFKKLGGGAKQNESGILDYKGVEREQRRIRKFFFLTRKTKKFHTEKNGLQISKNVKITSKSANEHSIVVAPTGGGKTATMVLPSLIALDHASIVVTDPKGEIYEKTKNMLKRKGYVCAHISFLPRTKGNIGYNLLAMCKTDDEIRELGAALMSSAVEGKDDQWGKLAMTFVLMFLYRNWKDRNGNDFRDENGKVVHRTLNDVIEEMTNSPSDKTQLELDYFTDAYPAAVTAFKQFAKTAGAEGYIASIVATVNEKLAVFQADIMAQVSEDRCFNPDWMRENKVALFISYPPNRAELFQPFLSAFYYQLFAKLQDHPSVDESLGRNDGLQIHFILDEFANAGKIPAFNNLLTTIRSKKMAVQIFVQSLSQLQLVYGRTESEVIFENCKTKCVLPGTVKETAKVFSDLTGERMYQTNSYSFGGSSGMSQSVSEQMRKVMSPDDVRQMDTEKVLVISDNLKPFMDDREYYYLSNLQFWLAFRLFKIFRVSEKNTDKLLKYFEGKKKLV